MGEHLVPISLKELLSVRVPCKKCGTIHELPIEKLNYQTAWS
jgi:hypothetical protein